MKIIVSKKIVPKGYAGITLFPFGIFVNNEKYLNNVTTINHEKIHWEQQKETIGIIFYLLYIIEWLIKNLIYGKKSYRNLSSEREAYHNEKNLNYLKTRKRYCWLKYIFGKP